MSGKTNTFLPLIFAALFIFIFAGCSDDGPTGNDDPDQIAERVVEDADGNIYRTVKIGDQTWMAENLRVTHYRNGDPILHASEKTAWNGLESGAYCVYQCDSDNAGTLGHLYNWYAVSDERNIAPAGWHVPTEEDWNELITFLGGEAEAGGKLKMTGTEFWQSPNTGATDAYRFSAVACGYRHHAGGFFNLGQACYMWSATERNSYSAWFRNLTSTSGAVVRYIYSSSKNNGYSVRCVKDK